MNDLTEIIHDKIRTVQLIGMPKSVATKLIELCNDPGVEIDELVDLIRLSQSLSHRFLAVANSAWSSPTYDIVDVKQCVVLIGLKNSQALTISHCLKTLYSGILDDTDDSKSYWAAAISKAATRRQLVKFLKRERGADEAFLEGLFADIGVPLLMSLNEDGTYRDLLLDSERDLQEQCDYECEEFGITHAEVGALLGEHLGLPDCLRQHIRVHSEQNPTVNGSSEAADLLVALLPHDIRSWKYKDVLKQSQIISEFFADQWSGVDAFLREVVELARSQMAVIDERGMPIPHLEDSLLEFIESAEAI